MNTIVLCGFRGTGKTTIGALLAKKLNWSFIEMDNEIERIAQKTIAEITQQGTDWESFRTLETQILESLLTRKQVVISAGGGVAVNSHTNSRTGRTFGEEQREILLGTHECQVIVLYASFPVLRQRIEREEVAKKETKRPILTHKRADILVQSLKLEPDSSRHKSLIVSSIIADAEEVYNHRKELYFSLSDLHFDTGTDSPELVVKRISETISSEL